MSIYICEAWYMLSTPGNLLGLVEGVSIRGGSHTDTHYIVKKERKIKIIKTCHFTQEAQSNSKCQNLSRVNSSRKTSFKNCLHTHTQKWNKHTQTHTCIHHTCVKLTHALNTCTYTDNTIIIIYLKIFDCRQYQQNGKVKSGTKSDSQLFNETNCVCWTIRSIIKIKTR